MPLILLLLLLSGCVTSNPQPEDTRFDENKRDWLEIYRQELIIAQQNNDIEAWHFFIQEFENCLANLDDDIQIDKKLVDQMRSQGKGIIPEIEESLNEYFEEFNGISYNSLSKKN